MAALTDGSVCQTENNLLLECALESVREYEISTTTKFCVRSTKRKDFGKTAFDVTHKHKILWEQTGGKGDTGLPFNGQPFISLNHMYLDCANGPERHANYKKKVAKTRADRQKPVKKRTMLLDTKKVNCPAYIFLREVLYFPDYEIFEDTRRRRVVKSKCLREDLKNGKIVKQERKIVVALPDLSAHTNHATGDSGGYLQPIDDKLKMKIAQLASKLITNTAEVKRHLSDYLTHVLFENQQLPNENNRRFYPTDSDIRNHVSLTLKRLRTPCIDREQIAKVLDDHSTAFPNNVVFFRPSEDEHQTLLILYQTENQKRLLELYGNNICLLDAMYRTTKYTVPLFFVYVKTNVDYQTVAMFVLEDEQTQHIIEALQKLQEANPEWNPTYFMTDYSYREILAIETVFPQSQVYICDFHREQAWCRWLSTGANGLVSQREEALQWLRVIAESSTEQDFESALSNLKESEIWKKNPKFSEWFSNEWEPQCRRWVIAFRSDAMGVNTYNDGIERQNECLKYQYLKIKTNGTLSFLISILIDQFFPKRYQIYVEKNLEKSRNDPNELAALCRSKLSDISDKTFDISECAVLETLSCKLTEIINWLELVKNTDGLPPLTENVPDQRLSEINNLEKEQESEPNKETTVTPIRKQRNVQLPKKRKLGITGPSSPHVDHFYAASKDCSENVVVNGFLEIFDILPADLLTTSRTALEPSAKRLCETRLEQ